MGYGQYSKERVVFLKEKDGSIMAYFPNIDEGNGQKMCYAHIGQHSACSPEYAKECTPANEKEYSDLQDELVSVGYTKLSIAKKI